MNCKNCGRQLKPGEVFCAACGTKNEAAQQHPQPPIVSTDEPKPPKATKKASSPGKKKLKAALIITALVLVLAAALVILILVLQNKKLKEPIVIDLNQYISTECFTEDGNPYPVEGESEMDSELTIKTGFSNDKRGAGLLITGYNTYASVKQSDLSNIIKWDLLIEDFNKKIDTKKGYESKEFGDFFSLSDFSFSIDKANSIANDDILKLSVATNGKDQFTSGDLTIQVMKGETTVKVAGLTTVNAIDPFAYIQLVASGANGEASLSIRIDDDLKEKIKGVKGLSVEKKADSYDSVVQILENGYVIAKFTYTLDENALGSEHSNDDYVSVSCSCDEIDELINKYKIFIANFNKEYKLSGLGEYITKDFSFNKKDLSAFTDYVPNIIKERYGDDDNYSSFAFHSAYIADVKDKTDSSYYSGHNELCVIYSYDYKTWEDKIETRYMCVYFKDLTAFDGRICSPADTYYSDYSTDYEKVQDILDRYGDEYVVEKV